MHKRETSILVTGASGFIGQYFLDAIKNHFKVFALSRRLPANNAITEHPNITWIQADLGSEDSIERVVNIIKENGGISFVFHLAGYYDFNYDLNPEYYRTNVLGTRNALEISRELDIERFIFASSVAACDFPKAGEKITEQTPADANFEYARTKKKGEELTQEYSKYFNTTVTRFAAAFSDWCEYGPLYIFLKTWFSKSWKSRILGGKGNAAITYIHVNCLIELILKVIKRSSELPAFDIYNVSPEFPVTHNELFQIATKYFYGKARKPFHMPKPIAFLGVVTMDFLGRMIGKRPFEKPWMMQYIDKKLYVDNSYTCQTLDWKPTNRYAIQRRLLYMIEHMKSYPYEWQKRNLKAFKVIPMNPNYKIYQVLEELRNKVVDQIKDHILSEKNLNQFQSYHSLDKTTLRKDILTVYQFLSVSVRSKDRVSALAYARQIARLRHEQGFNVAEVIDAFNSTGEIIRTNLTRHPGLKGMERDIYDEISLTFQLMADEIESTFEFVVREKSPLLSGG